MGAFATNTSTQIKILKKRGMILDWDESKVEEILLDIGYYRLGFYWYPFEKDKKHNFRPGTKFSDVVSLYYLDVDLRNILMKSLNRIEVNFRTKLVYHISNHYKNDPVWYTNPKIVTSWFLSDRLNHYYSDRFKRDNKLIQLHHYKYRNHKYAPVWKTFEFFPFGYILTVFNCLKERKLREDIALMYGLNRLATFNNLMTSIKELRNTCAHSGVLLDFHFSKGISKIPKTKFNKNDNQSFDAGIKAMLFILSSISKDRRNELSKKINERLKKEKNNTTIRAIIEEKMCYQFT